MSQLKCSFESDSIQHYMIWFVSDDLPVVYVGSHSVVNHLKTMQTCSLWTHALQNTAKNERSFKYESRCSKKKQQKIDMRTDAPKKNKRKWHKRPVRKQILQKTKNQKQKPTKKNKTKSWTLCKLPVWEQGLKQKQKNPAKSIKISRIGSFVCTSDTQNVSGYVYYQLIVRNYRVYHSVHGNVWLIEILYDVIVF